MVNAEECRRNAAECRELARTAPTSKQRNIVFDMARTWETMAQHADRLGQQKEADTK